MTFNPRIYHRSLLVVIIPLSDAQKMYESEVQKDFKFMLAVKVRRLNRTTQKRIRDFCGGGIHSHTHFKNHTHITVLLYARGIPITPL